MCALFSKSATDHPRESFSFQFYDPVVPTDQLVPGIDNIRFDVSLSSKFLQYCRGLICQLIVQHSAVAALLNNPPALPKGAERNEFKQQFQNLLINLLNRANIQKNPQRELLGQAAVLKALAGEIQVQYGLIVVQAREKLRLFDSPAHAHHARGYQLHEMFSNFQKNKKIILRLVGQELLDMMAEVRASQVRRTRESFFGKEASLPHAIFSHPLIFAEEGKDDYLYMEQYVMLGNFQRDPDRFEVVEQQVREFLEWADVHSPEARRWRTLQETCEAHRSQLERLRGQPEEQAPSRRFFQRPGRAAAPAIPPNELREQTTALAAQLEKQSEELQEVATAYSARLDRIIAAPENAALLVDYFQTEQLLGEARKSGADAVELAALQQRAETQREAMEQLVDRFSRSGLLPYIVAAYETARIYRHFCPPINPQQLKGALVDAVERKKVIHLIQEYRLPGSPVETMEEAARRVREIGARETRMVLARFLYDFFRCRHDLKNHRLAQDLMEQIYIPADAKQRELSEINNTLYQFLLPEEEKPAEEKIASHVILKADIRDSTSITTQLFARNLNPASYFSLNFYEPVRKLLPRYGATKVFLEGDAMILAIVEHEGDVRSANSVARACCLAREMIEGVRGVNDRAAQSQLPLLEFGIGICFQPSTPMYLMDGERPIMISKALNESDRLSSCSKLAKQSFTQKSRFFNVFVMQVLPDAESKDVSEEFLLHYNVQGIEINELAFDRLCQELSMKRVELKLPLLGEPETVELFCGSSALGQSIFQRIVVRRGRVPHWDPKELRIVEYTDRYYYEVCSAKPVYEFVAKTLGW
ncbi:MAG: hypothetical protein HY651_06585 [Acidobacteria bacterium]|nr:hypothetical protein [Acidobacteriota bacterium]